MRRRTSYRRALPLVLFLCLLFRLPAALGAEGEIAVPEGGQLVKQGTVVIPIQGGMVSRTDVISVVLPMSIPFVLDMAEDGTLDRVLSATGAITNYSLSGVDVAVNEVKDTGGLLTQMELYLAAGDGQVKLTDGTAQALPLATLPASPDGIAGQSLPLTVGGSATGALSYGDGDTFNVDITLKVSKKTA